MGYYTGMKIVLATPLYPPDLGEPAAHVKELAVRLAKNNDVSVVTYGRLPEKVAGVSVISVSKRRPLPVRLAAYTFALLRAARRADVIYAENGPSVELPAGLAALLTRRPLIVHLGDRAAHALAEYSVWRRALERFALGRAKTVIRDNPPSRPEILPLQEPPADALAEYEAAWKSHLALLKEAFNHARR